MTQYQRDKRYKINLAIKQLEELKTKLIYERTELSKYEDAIFLLEEMICDLRAKRNEFNF